MEGSEAEDDGSTSNPADDLSRMVYSEGGFYFHSELFPGGSDHVKNDPRGMYWPRAQEEMSGNGTGSPKWVMLRNLTSKFVYRPTGQSELYDLEIDPRELRNVIDDSKYANLRAEMTEKMMAWLVVTGDVPPLRNDPRGMPPASDPVDEETCREIMQPQPPEARRDLLAVNGVHNFVS